MDLEKLTSTEARRRFLTVGVVLMLILAGCSTASQQPGSQPEQPVQTTIPTPTPTSATPTTPTKQAEKSVEYSQVTYYNATETEIQAINETMAHFFEDLPENRLERTAIVAKMAKESCNARTVNKTLFASASFTHERGQQLYHVARLMRNNYNSRINPTRIRKVAQRSAEIGKYTTIVGTYNKYHEASCAFDRDNPETIEDYYLASAALGFELLMFQYGMYYKTAFKANRVLSHHRTYRVVQATFGDDALGLMMSGSYWLVHGTLQAAPNFARNQADEMDITLSRDATRVDHHGMVERFAGAKVVPRSVSETAKQCYNRVRNQSKSNGGLFSQGKKLTQDITGKFREGKYTTSEVLGTAKGVNPQELSEEQMKKVSVCVDEQAD